MKKHYLFFASILAIAVFAVFVYNVHAETNVGGSSKPPVGKTVQTARPGTAGSTAKSAASAFSKIKCGR